MRKKPTDVIVWDHGDRLVLDLPKGAVCHTLSDGTLRATISTPAGAPALDSIVDCIGRPITTRVAA